MTHDRVGSLVAWLVRWRLPLFVVAIVVAAAAIPAAFSLRFDQRIESLYAADDPHRSDYLESRSLFGGDELALVAWEQPGLFREDGSLDPEVAAEIVAFAERLSAIPGVNASSTQHLPDALNVPFGRDDVRKLMEGMLVDEPVEDRPERTTGIILRFVPEDEAPADPETEEPTTRGETIRLVREAARAHGEETGHPTYVVGEPVQIHDMFRYVEEDGNTFFLWTVALLAVVVFAYFRSLRWTLLPLGVVLASILWTRGLLAVLDRLAGDFKLSMVSSMLNSLVTIIGVATVTHITVRFREHRRLLGPRDALVRTFVELLPAVFWTCATTIVGFAALLSSQIAPIRGFGSMMALGTTFVFVATCTLIPGGVLLGRKGDAPPYGERREGPLSHALARLAGWVERFGNPLLLGGLALMAVCFAGLYRLTLETDFSRNFHAESDIIRSLEFYEARIGGAGTWEVNVPAPRTLSVEYLDRVRELARRLREMEDEKPEAERQVTKVIAVTDGLDLIPAKVEVTLPFVGKRTQEVPLAQRLAGLSGMQPEFLPSLYNPAEGRMRVILRARERVPAETKRTVIERAEEIARELFPPDEEPAEPKATGLYVLLVFLIESLMRDQVVSFVIAAIGILLMMTIAFRSPVIGLVSLVPNLFPICIVLGGMGWLGMRINIATAMIACVSMGLTTDATVHFITAYRRSRAEGRDVHAAMSETLQGTGRAIVYATIALVVGFSVLTLSHFVPLVYFGLLVDAAMIGGLFGDLVLLPILLAWTDRGQRRRETTEYGSPASNESLEPAPNPHEDP